MAEAMLLQVWSLWDWRITSEKEYRGTSSMKALEARQKEVAFFYTVMSCVVASAFAFTVGRIFDIEICWQLFIFAWSAASLCSTRYWLRLGLAAESVYAGDKEQKRAPKMLSREIERQDKRFELQRQRTDRQRARRNATKASMTSGISEIGVTAGSTPASDDREASRDERASCFANSKDSLDGTDAGLASAGRDSNDSIGDAYLCVCCNENEALFVMNHCGHVVFCRTCRRKAVHTVLCQGSGSHAVPCRSELGSRELTRTEVTCPLCRAPGLLIAKTSYEGVIFES